MTTIIRQGDIILKEIPDTGEIEKKNNYRDALANYRTKVTINTIQLGLVEVKSKIVAYGEATGHQHKFVSGQVSLFRTLGQAIPKIVEIESEHATLSHQQHMPIQIPKGIYEVIKEKSYDPFAKAIQVIED